MRDNTPVLIGAGQFTFRGEIENSPSPLQLLKIAAERAVADAGLLGSDLAGLDAMVVIAFSIDAPGGLSKLPMPRLINPPSSLARALGADPAWKVYTETGGNSPQQAVNAVCERIAQGSSELALVAGAEFLGSLMKRLKGGLGFDGWGDDLVEAPERMGDPRPGVTAQEAAHGLGYPVNTYPLFENALRARDDRSLQDHQQRLGELFSPFSKVAAGNPMAWFPLERSAEELTTVTDRNRMISFPYPKYLNAIMEVDQSAAILICSVRKARELGVSEDKWVYLHGCADAADLWYPLDRQNFHSSPAIRLTGERALEMAGVTLADIDIIDLYSCFPSAVQVAAEELGLALDDPRGLTITGGLPYFGGPGNNYALHSIAEMMTRLRERPGAFGLCTANGWFLTKQSIGIYSTKPFDGDWVREAPSRIQAQIDSLPHPEIVERPVGPSTIETYTVVHSREGVRMGIVVGRDASGRRFVAHTPDDPATLLDLESREGVGRTGIVGPHPDGVRNLFIPD
ncbi:acetyl-CoA acetyltransferase [Caulobacter henricii]|uniref:Acetyl-CoA acetyltransferase n=1 Tax=Caulobacter henricii TaxID=69395 RepID=A0A0N7JHH0_9CAUL|nr:acetyl-CoA acetyltransferase [Caulobacter henricii]ALL13370.1 acetyl-CoA acetyltransferase [Caulobacter henricii]